MIVEAAIFGSVSSDFKGWRRHFLPLCSMGLGSRLFAARQRILAFIEPPGMKLMKPTQMLKEYSTV
jgi:hypothetical protein